jgi:phage baseplate assembly protein W
MAYNVVNINPLDLSPSKGVGIQIPFNGPTGLNITYTTKEATKSNIFNFFLTGKKERIMNPTFGSGLRAFIFEQITAGNLDGLRENIQSQLTRYFPNVLVASLDIFQDPDINTITVSLTYNVIDTAISDEIQIAFN